MRRGLGVALAAGTMLLATVVTAGAPPRWATAVLPSGHEFSLEIAADAASRERGYMFRDRVGPRDGMLFLFESTDRWPFWMKNCRVSLDILWLDDAFRVVWVAASAMLAARGIYGRPSTNAPFTTIVSASSPSPPRAPSAPRQASSYPWPSGFGA